VADTAKVLSRYVDAIMIRKLDHEFVLELARHSSVPVINGLTRKSHPCQVMADIVTFVERKGPIAGKRIAWSGDANNVLNSWIQAAERFRFGLAIATPRELPPPADLVEKARAGGADIVLTSKAEEAAAAADCVVTDTWVSMGDSESERRRNLLTPYRVTSRVMAAAKPDSIFMHCLPAHRGEEVEAAVIDGPQSVVFDEAENRLHAQKGILAWCLGAGSTI
jgi:ornithine carbamoyltransferase